MPDALEEAALSGALSKDNYRPPERSGTPEASDSGSEPDSEDYHHNHPAGESQTALIEEDEIHAKGAQTGIKGVLNDKKAHTRSTQSKEKEERRGLKERMEKMSIVGNTWKEEEDMRAKEKDQEGGIEKWRKGRIEEMKARKGLREVGKEGFVSAVEREGWVCVLIYEPVSLDSYALVRDELEERIQNADYVGNTTLSNTPTRNDHTLHHPLDINYPNNIITSPSDNTSFLTLTLLPKRGKQ
jgi:hypothetical protein